MRLLRRPRSEGVRPAERFLAAAAGDARSRGHGFIGTEHLLICLVRGGENHATRILRALGVTPASVETALGRRLAPRHAGIDRDALATLGIDLDAVVARLEATFGPGALERTRSGCLGISPRAKMALAAAVDRAGDGPVGEQHVLLGLLSVPDSVAGRALHDIGVTLAHAESLP